MKSHAITDIHFFVLQSMWEKISKQQKARESMKICEKSQWNTNLSFKKIWKQLWLIDPYLFFNWTYCKARYILHLLSRKKRLSVAVSSKKNRIEYYFEYSIYNPWVIIELFTHISTRVSTRRELILTRIHEYSSELFEYSCWKVVLAWWVHSLG
jgi:hypothetical protein